jgi:hypothetical protein
MPQRIFRESETKTTPLPISCAAYSVGSTATGVAVAAVGGALGSGAGVVGSATGVGPVLPPSALAVATQEVSRRAADAARSTAPSRRGDIMIGIY